MSAALLSGGALRASLFLNGALKHSETLMPLVDEALTRSGLVIGDMDRIACVVGPGSFTGVRIGVSTARGLSYATGIPCVPVNALEALAFGVCFAPSTICPILDARRGHVYAAAFGGGGGLKRLTEDVVQPLDEYIALLPNDGSLLFLGDGMSAHKAHIMEVCGDRAHFAPPHLSQLTAAAAAALAARTDVQAVPGRQLKPLYLRKAQAERERDDA